MTSTTLLTLSLSCLGAALAGLTLLLLRRPVLERPTLGHRGLQRGEALRGHPPFALIEPAARMLGGLLSALPLDELRGRLKSQIQRSGGYLGLCPNELLALSVLGAAAGLTLALLARDALGLGGVSVAAATLFGCALPQLQLRGEISRRFEIINRTLPPTIDLAALCMGAGMDFAGALGLLVREGNEDELCQEFAQVLRALDTGHSRREALEDFARRVPTDAVREFVAAVVQAEEKGNPLAEVLQVQAGMLRMRRSVAAEEAAARAAVLLVFPLMLLLACVLLVMFGPFILNGTGL